MGSKIKLNKVPSDKEYASIGISFPHIEDGSQLDPEVVYDGVSATNIDGTSWYFINNSYGYPSEWFDVITDEEGFIDKTLKYYDL